MQIAILIVVYDKQLNESETLMSLIRLLREDKSRITYCRIMNNGPTEITNNLEMPGNLVVDFIQLITNKPLSMIYNNFINDYEGFDRFVILDDDSELNIQYLEVVFQEKYYDIEIPKTYDNNGKIFFPIINNKVIRPRQNIIDNSKNVINSITSGLVISGKLVDLFKKNRIKLFNDLIDKYRIRMVFSRD